MMAFRRTLAALALLTACEHEDPTDSVRERDGGRPRTGLVLGCQDAELLVAASLASDARLVALRGCSTDRDCAVHALPSFRCDDRQILLTSCDLPVAVGNLDASVAYVHDLERALCTRIAPDCRVGASCAPAQSRCVRGECTMVARAPADAGL